MGKSSLRRSHFAHSENWKLYILAGVNNANFTSSLSKTRRFNWPDLHLIYLFMLINQNWEHLKIPESDVVSFSCLIFSSNKFFLQVPIRTRCFELQNKCHHVHFHSILPLFFFFKPFAPREGYMRKSLLLQEREINMIYFIPVFSC